MANISWKKFLRRQPPDYKEIWESGMLHNYTIEKCADEISMPSTVMVSDTTCRDGEQMPGVFFTPEQKLEIVRKLKDLGLMRRIKLIIE